MFIVYLPVLKVPVDLLGFIEQVEHLPQSKLKIHLSEVIRRRYKRQIHQVQIGRIENSLYTRMTPSSTELPINNGTLTFT